MATNAADYDINGTWAQRDVDGAQRWVFVSTVKPSGGDFATLQAWHTAVAGVRAGQSIVDNDSVERTVAGGELWAECYGGGDLGTLAIAFSSFQDADADHFPRIYAADSHWQNGRYDGSASPQGAWIHNETVGSNDYPLHILASYVRVEGLRITGVDQAHAGVSVVSYAARQGVVIDGCCAQIANSSATRHVHCFYVALSHSSQDAAAAAVVRNCIAYGLGEDSVTMGFAGKVECGTDNQELTLTLDLYNNTAVNVNDNTTDARAAFYTVATDGGYSGCTADLLGRCQNNLVVGESTAVCFGELLGGVGDVAFDPISHNLSSDAAAWGSSSQLNAAMADTVVSSQDAALIPGSAAIGAAADLSAYVTDDSLNRPRSGAWDIGALATVNAVGGATLTTSTASAARRRRLL